MMGRGATRTILLAVAALVAATTADAKKPSAKASPRLAAKRVAPRAVRASVAWHTPAPNRQAPVDARGRPKLVVFSLNTQERVELTAMSDGGGFSAEDLERAAHALREPSSGNEHPIHPRILDVVYRLQRRFTAQEIRVISGYRTPRGGRASNHGKGRAIDLVVPGASDDDIATFAREQGFVGVGVYPVSGFVHVDVRDRSFFWVDTSGPGRRSRLRAVLGGLAREVDEKARARGDAPVEPFVVAPDVDATRPADLGTPSPPPAEDDDHEHPPEE